MPLVSGRLTFALVVLVAVALGDAFGDEGDDFGVIAVERIEGVGHDIVLRWATRGGGNAVDDFFVGFVVEVLVAEHSNTTLRDCEGLLAVMYHLRCKGRWLTGNSQIAEECVSVGRFESFSQVQVDEF